MLNIIGMEYVLPPPQASPDIPAVASVKPKKGLGKNRKRDKEDALKKRKSTFKELLEKEAMEELGQMGCFFEAKV